MVFFCFNNLCYLLITFIVPAFRFYFFKVFSKLNLDERSLFFAFLSFRVAERHSDANYGTIVQIWFEVSKFLHFA